MNDALTAQVQAIDELTRHLTPELEVEEGFTLFLYDDAKGPKPFKKGDVLVGNLTFGAGINAMTGFDQAECRFIEGNRINKIRQALVKDIAWFAKLDVVRQTALADIAYNIGAGGLLHWPHFLSYMAAGDYARAVDEIKSDELWVSQVHATRANRIEQMIATGVWPADIPVPQEPPGATVA